MTPNTMIFGKKVILPSEIKGKRLIEIGSYDVNGSYSYFVKDYLPSEYIAVDMQSCNHSHPTCVTHVLNCLDLVNVFGLESFDYVISTEMLEHAEHWKKCISIIKQLTKLEGYIVLTTRSPGFPLHNYPGDWWRFTMKDMEKIFSDCEILNLEPEISQPGVFIKVRKPINFIERNLNFEVYSMK